MNHTWYERGDGHSCNDMGECILCSLAVCKVCGLYEGGLTTDCPGEMVSMEKSEEIYTQKLDYREGEGWVNKFSPHMQNSLYRCILDFQRGKSSYNSELELMMAFGANKNEYNEIKKKLLKDLITRG